MFKRACSSVLAALAGVVLAGAATAAARPVEVMVRLKLPAPPAAGKAQAADAATAALRAAQDGVLARLRAAGAGAAGAGAAGAGAKGRAGEVVANVVRFDVAPGMALMLDRSLLPRLRQDPAVLDLREARPERVVGALGANLAAIRADAVWAKGGTGSGEVIAVLDTGVDKEHPALAGKVVAEGCYGANVPGVATSLCEGAADSSTAAGSGRPCPDSFEACAHGTHVAAIAAGQAASFAGVAKGAKLIALKVFKRYERAADCAPLAAPCLLSSPADQIKALERVYALRSSLRIAAVNMSLGGGAYAGACDAAESLRAAIIDRLDAAGIPVVVAAGNDGLDGRIGTPACIRRAVAVAAAKGSGSAPRLAAFSNFGPAVDLLAPGAQIRSAVPGSTFEAWSGTSMAAPHVAGAIALLHGAAINAPPAAVVAALASTGRPVSRASVTRPFINLKAAYGALRPTPARSRAATAS